MWISYDLFLYVEVIRELLFYLYSFKGYLGVYFYSESLYYICYGKIIDKLWFIF